MKKTLLFLSLLGVGSFLTAQEVKFEEYDLANGLHVILHQDNAAPVVTTSVLYHVGAKDEEPNRTGFAHFLSTFYLKGLKILSEESGSVLFPLMEEKTMPTLTTILRIIMKFSLRII